MADAYDRADSSDDDREFRLDLDHRSINQSINDTMLVHAHPVSDVSREKMIEARRKQEIRKQELYEKAMKKAKIEAKKAREITEKEWEKKMQAINQSIEKEQQELMKLQRQIAERRNPTIKPAISSKPIKSINQSINQSDSDEEAELNKIRMRRRKIAELKKQMNDGYSSTEELINEDIQSINQSINQSGASKIGYEAESKQSISQSINQLSKSISQKSSKRTTPQSFEELDSISQSINQSVNQSINPLPPLPTDLSPPDASLLLSWVSGYNTINQSDDYDELSRSINQSISQSNIALNSKNDLIYPCSSIAIVQRNHQSINQPVNQSFNQSSKRTKQVYFTAHTGRIGPLTQHPVHRDWIATSHIDQSISRSISQSIKQPINQSNNQSINEWGKSVIYVWNSLNTGQCMKLIDETPPNSQSVNQSINQSINQLCFSSDNLIAGLCIDQFHTLKIFDWKEKKMIAAVHTGGQQMCAVKFNHTINQSINPSINQSIHQSKIELVTVGVEHIAFWSLKNGILTGHQAIMPLINPSINPYLSQSINQPINHTYFCAAFDVRGSAIIGGPNGCVYIYHNETSEPIQRSVSQSVDRSVNQSISQSISQSINQSIDVVSLITFDGGLVAGFSNGSVVILDHDCIPMRSISLSINQSINIQSIAIDEAHNLFIGATNGAIYQSINLSDSQTINQSTNQSDGEINQLVAGHFAGDLQCLGQLNQSSNQPTQSVNQSINQSVTVTAGQDNQLLIWDTETHRLIDSRLIDVTAPLDSTHAIPSSRALSISINQSINQSINLIAIGTAAGSINLYDKHANLLTACPVHVTHAPVTSLQWSPIDDVIAAGLSNGLVVLCKINQSRGKWSIEIGASTTITIGQNHDFVPVAVRLIDWSIDGRFLIVTDDSNAVNYLEYEPLTRTVQPIKSSELIAVHHAIYQTNCNPLAWHTHSLYSASNRNLNTTKQCTRGDLLVSSNDGTLELYRWSGRAARGMKSRQTRAHVGAVGAMQFVSDDLLVTVGRQDRAVMHWKIVRQ